MTDQPAFSHEWSREIDTQPQVGISACLRGEKVRYDGDHKFQPLIDEQLAPWLNFVTFCPEAAAELGVPRPPVRLIETDMGIQARGVENNDLDVTQALSQTSDQFATHIAVNLAAYIVKSRSPSCGSGSTPLYNSDSILQGTTDGLFVRALKAARPDLIIVDENWLNSPARCQEFLQRCYNM